jgi:signal transduction histidine kinase
MGTPLNTISIRSGMIASQDVTGEDTVESAKIIKAQAKRVTAIIQQFLDYARKRKLEKKCVDLLEVAQQTQQFLTPLCEKQGVMLTVTSSGPAVASVDSSQIEHVLTNLIVNAVQAMPNGGEVKVEIDRQVVQPPADHGGVAGGYLRIRISDEGEGITEQDIKHIFEPFFTTKDVGEGSGLGLSIVYGIIQEHSGWIDVTSKPGEGSCFTVFLPTEGHVTAGPAIA